MTTRIYMKGTTTAAGAANGSTVIDTTRKEPNGTFNGAMLKITSGAYAGQERQVSTWTQSTGTFLMATYFPGQIVAGVTYEVGVTLPVDPSKCEDEWPPDISATKMPNALPYIISWRGARKLRFEGYIFVQGYSKSSLETNYVIPLRNMYGRVVTVDGPDTRYDGDYILKVVIGEQAGFTTLFTYKIELQQGSEYVVL